ncbi:MAG: hypothetical protein Q8R28_15405 [Dehalococcoidia bacterium]|nr:hypothetical protein [Dehalococcoidia bacterium]
MRDLFTDEVKWVILPFGLRVRKQMLAQPSPMKTQTARYTKHGESGDCFMAFGASFTILTVYRRMLGLVAVHYQAEGFDTFKDFKAYWEQLHPKRGYRPEDMVWVHTFRRNRQEETKKV